jgi:hypothetical protein
MRTNRVVCVKTEHPHRHIVSVGVGDSKGTAMIIMSVDSVRRNIDAGDVFETYSPSTGKIARVKKDNNLDNLPTC